MLHSPSVANGIARTKNGQKYRKTSSIYVSRIFRLLRFPLYASLRGMYGFSGTRRLRRSPLCVPLREMFKYQDFCLDGGGVPHFKGCLTPRPGATKKKIPGPGSPRKGGCLTSPQKFRREVRHASLQGVPHCNPPPGREPGRSF